MKIHLDVTSNGLDNPSIRKQVEDNLRKSFKKKLPKIIERMKEVPPLFTTDVGLYSKFHNEAKECYELGLYHATISMVGVTAERFTMELSEKLKFKINENSITEKELFGRVIRKEDIRLNILEKAKLLKSEYTKKLKKIREIRNKYIHPREEENAKEDSLKILKLYIEILNSRFSDEWIIKNGKIVKK